MTSADDPASLAVAIEEQLRGHPGAVLTTSELRARLRSQDQRSEDHRIDCALRALQEAGRIVLVERPPLDRHLPALTAAALVDAAGSTVEALARAADCCAGWERRLLARHRCH